MLPDDTFYCNTLKCRNLRVRVCVKRQVDSEVTRAEDRPAELARHDGKRGTAPEYPSCATSRCAQGRAILHALVADVIAGVRSGDRSDLAAQRAAQHAVERVSPPPRGGEPTPSEPELHDLIATTVHTRG